MNANAVISRVEKDIAFFPWSVEVETAQCIASLALLTCAKRVLEIGTHLGYASFHILRDVPGCHITTVDMLPTCKKYISLLNHSERKRFHFVQKRNDRYYSGLKKNDVFDFIFIDAEHTCIGALYDFRSVLRHASPRATIIFHDVYMEELRYFVKLSVIINGLFLGRIFDTVTFNTPKKPQIPQDYRSGLQVFCLKPVHPFVFRSYIRVLRGIEYMISYHDACKSMYVSKQETCLKYLRKRTAFL